MTHKLRARFEKFFSMTAENYPWNKYDIAIGGWSGLKSRIRYGNAYASEYLSGLSHTWNDYDGMRWNTVLRVIDGSIQFIFDSNLSYVSMEPRELFFEYGNNDIEKEDLKYLRVSTWYSTPVPKEGLKWSFKPKVIPTGKIRSYKQTVYRNHYLSEQILLDRSILKVEI